MKLSQHTLEFLKPIIMGERQGYGEPKKGYELVAFFNGFGSKDEYPDDFSSRTQYTMAKLQEHNGTASMQDIITGLLTPLNFEDEDLRQQISERLAAHLVNDGYRLVAEEKDSIKNKSNPDANKKTLIYKVQLASDKFVGTDGMLTLSNSNIIEQIEKAKAKIETDDFSGAITNARALVETFLIEILKEMKLNVPDHKGDIMRLYKKVMSELNLDPSQKTLTNALQETLSGLVSILKGMSSIRNTSGDAHASKHKPSHHHAKLTVNVAFTFCEFLLDSYEYQKRRKAREVAG